MYIELHPAVLHRAILSRLKIDLPDNEIEAIYQELLDGHRVVLKRHEKLIAELIPDARGDRCIMVISDSELF